MSRVLVALLVAMPAMAADDPGLAQVNADAIAFLHIRAGDAFTGAHAEKRLAGLSQETRELLALIRDFAGVPLADLDTFTLILPSPPEERGIPFIAVLTFDKPLDRDAILKELRQTTIKKVRGVENLWGGLRLHFPTDKSLAIYPAFLDKRYRAGVAAPGPNETAVSKAVTLAKTGRHFAVGAVHIAGLPPEDRQQLVWELPAEMESALDLMAARSLTWVADLERGFGLTATLTFHDAKAAEVGLKTGEALLGRCRATLKQAPKDKPAPIFERFVEKASLASDGAVVTAKLNLPLDDVPLAELLGGTVSVARGFTDRGIVAGHFRRMAIGMHEYHDTVGHLPAAIFDAKGTALLSWRVAILPHIGEKALFAEFALDEPWDSARNKTLLAKMPKVYRNPRGLKPEVGKTHYRVFSGNGALFDTSKDEKITLQGIMDGTSNTLLIAEAAEAVEWTKPDELAYDPQADIEKLLLFGPSGTTMFVMGDGSVRYARRGTAKKQWHAWIGRADGMPVELPPGASDE